MKHRWHRIVGGWETALHKEMGKGARGFPRPPKTLAGLLPMPLLHVVGGKSNFWDEVVTSGLMGLFLAVLLFLSFRAGRKRRKQQSKKGRRAGRLR